MPYPFLLLAMLCVALTCGCVSGQGKTSVSEFRGFCLTGGGDGSQRSDCDTNGPCDAFSAAISQDFASLDQCLAACDQTFQQNVNANLNCSSTVNKANRLCLQYCRKKYPAQ